MNKTSKSSLSIAIDGNEANVKNRVGSNVYAFELLTALEKLTRDDHKYSFTILLSAPVLKDLPKERTNWRYQVIGPKIMWTQIALPLYLAIHQPKLNLFFTPGHYAPKVCPIPYVSSIMDLAFLHYPLQFKKKDLTQLKIWTQFSAQHAKKIITISDFSKNDVIKSYHRQKSDVVVAYPALRDNQDRVSLSDISEVMTKYQLTAPYFLYVGTIQPRKNLVTLVEAFESACRFSASANFKNARQKKLPELVIAGKIGWLADTFLNRVKQSTFVNQIKLIGFVNDQDKRSLYAGAQALIQVGLYEGFGLPPLEAMAVGTLCIVADNSSLPEVIGNAGLIVNPTKPALIANALKRVLVMTKKEKGIFRQKMRQQIQKFSWEKSAQIVLNTLQEVANG